MKCRFYVLCEELNATAVTTTETTTIAASCIFFTIFLRCFVFSSDYEIAFQFNSVVVYRFEYIPFRSTFRPLIFLFPHKRRTEEEEESAEEEEEEDNKNKHTSSNICFGIVYDFGLMSVEAVHLRIQFSYSTNMQPGLETSIVIDFCVLCLAQVSHALVVRLPMTTSPKVESWMALHYSGDRPCASHRRNAWRCCSHCCCCFCYLLLLMVVKLKTKVVRKIMKSRMGRLVCTRCCFGYAMHNVLIIRWKLCANTVCCGIARECRTTYTMYILTVNSQFPFFPPIKFVCVPLSLCVCLFMTSYSASEFNVRMHTIAIFEWLAEMWMVTLVSILFEHCEHSVDSLIRHNSKEWHSKPKFIFRKWVH